jgi:nucleoside-diphosphate-sugar epimerase
MRPTSKVAPTAGLVLLGGLAVFALVARAEARPSSPAPMPPAYASAEAMAPEALEAAQAARGAPRFVYASGFQGVGYYANPGTVTTARQAPAPTFSGASRGQSVGPGVRDWSTGRRGRLHKPWLQPR